LVEYGSVLLIVLLTWACGGSTPTSPGHDAVPVPGPRLLVAGNSNAVFLVPYLPEAIDESNIDGSIDYWLSSSLLAQAARSANLWALVWWQGGRDTGMPADQYAEKLRALIRGVRSVNTALPIRIVEIPDTPDRARVRQAQREVSADPGVELIPTADLPFDAAGHLPPEGYTTVRDRLYRSLGR
jgi:hypothetical protein